MPRISDRESAAARGCVKRRMKPIRCAAAVFAATLLTACDLRYAVLGFPQPTARIEGAAPIELTYREARGGLVVLRGRVNDKADVDFILDTGAPVSVLIDGAHTRALGLDSSKARRLGGDSPGSPMGDIQDGFQLAFDRLTLSGLTAVVIPYDSMPCREKFDEVGFGGVIGADLFRQFVVEIDTTSRRVRLHSPQDWRAPQGAAPLPISFNSGHPYVETRVTLGDGTVVDMRMNVDTGMNRTLTLAAGSHPAIVMPTEGATRRSCYVNGVRDEREGGTVSVALGGTSIEVARPIYSDHPNAVDGGRTSTIGVGMFQGRRLVVDYPGRRLFMLDPPQD